MLSRVWLVASCSTETAGRTHTIGVTSMACLGETSARDSFISILSDVDYSKRGGRRPRAQSHIAKRAIRWSRFSQERVRPRRDPLSRSSVSTRSSRAVWTGHFTTTSPGQVARSMRRIATWRCLVPREAASFCRSGSSQQLIPRALSVDSRASTSAWLLTGKRGRRAGFRRNRAGGPNHSERRGILGTGFHAEGRRFRVPSSAPRGSGREAQK